MGIQSNNSHLIFVVFSPVFSTFMVLLNVLTMVVFIKRFRLASLALVMMVNICLCDIIVCLFSNNFYALNLLHPTYAWNTGALACKLFKTLTMGTNLAQIFSLVILNLDRLRRMMHGQAEQWTRRQGHLFLFLTWFLAAIIAAPRAVLFDEKVITKTMPGTNESKVVNYGCKPIGLKDTYYVVMTLTQFVIGYIIPCVCMIFTLVRSHMFMRQHEKLVKATGASVSNTIRMNRQLSLTFSLTGLMFLAIWTPFFVLSIWDLFENILGNKELAHMNFTLRCTLLVIGSAKPFLYMIGLRKFRMSLLGVCSPTEGPRRGEDESSTGGSYRVWNTSKHTVRQTTSSASNMSKDSDQARYWRKKQSQKE